MKCEKMTEEQSKCRHKWLAIKNEGLLCTECGLEDNSPITNPHWTTYSPRHSVRDEANPSWENMIKTMERAGDDE